MNLSEFQANTCNRLLAGFGLTFHWLTKWREFLKPVTERRKAKPKQTRNYVRCDKADIQVWSVALNMIFRSGVYLLALSR